MTTSADGADRTPDATTGRTANQRVWDERAPAHLAGDVYRVDEVVAGRDDLRPWEDDEVGPSMGWRDGRSTWSTRASAL